MKTNDWIIVLVAAVLCAFMFGYAFHATTTFTRCFQTGTSYRICRYVVHGGNVDLTVKAPEKP